MRLSIFGIWIVLISIVKCQTDQLNGCYDLVTKVTAEVSPFLQSTICADNSPTTIIVSSPRGFWINNAIGFCTSIDLNIGFIELNFLVTSPNLSIQLTKHSATLDAAKVSLSIQEEYSATHLVTVWGHQNTRFVLKIVRTCNNVETTSAAFTTPGNRFSMLVGVTENTFPQTSQQTTLRTTQSTNPRFDQSTNTETIRKQNTGNIGNANDKKSKNNDIISTSTQGTSVEIAKIAWMESKRIEFEKKMESLRYSEDYSGDNGATEYFNGIKASKMATLTTSLSTEMFDAHQNSQEVGLNTVRLPSSYSAGHDHNLGSDFIIPSTITVIDYRASMKSTTYVMLGNSWYDTTISLNVETNDMIQPTSVINDVVTVFQNSIPKDGDDTFSNIKIQPSVQDFSFSSLSTGPAAFLPIYETTTKLSLDSISKIYTKTKVPMTTPLESTFHSAIIPSKSSSFLPELETTIATHSNSHIYSSENGVSSSLIVKLPSSLIVNLPSSLPSTIIPTSYTVTPTPLPAITEAHVKTTGDTMTSTSRTPKYPDHSSTYHTKTPSIENSTVPLKKAKNDEDGETFWPVVAALVVGIPSVVVFGIAIVVIHRRRSPVARKIFAMRSFSNVSTPSSSLPGYTHISSKRTSPSQSSV